MRVVPFLALLVACAPEYELSGVEAPVPGTAASARPARQGGADAPAAGSLAAPASAARPPVGIVAAPPRTFEVELGGGAPTEVVDYLFVIDGSVSMNAVIERVLAGLEALAAEGDVFPADARIAVMGTTPADPRNRRKLHRVAPADEWLRLDPAFGDPVDAERIARFREVAPAEWVDRFALDGCDAWFAPGDRNPDGVPCLVAHTQSLLYPVVVEAGLTALGQRLADRRPLFRTGAAVNVIFVSDTHDPGLPEQGRAWEELVANRPTFELLEALAFAHHDLASFRVHAIAPRDRCSDEPWTGDLAYFDAADAGGGLTLDVCTATPADYVALVGRMVTEGAVPTRAVVPLREAGTVSAVKVDGAPVAFSLSRDGRAVVLPELPSRRSRVAVELAPAPKPPRAPAPQRAPAR